MNITAIIQTMLTILIVLTSIVQAYILQSQRQQQRLDWAESYRKRWSSSYEDWATVIFIGRQHGDYCQIADEKLISELNSKLSQVSNSTVTIWALTATRNVCGLLSDLCFRILSGKLNISDIYTIFGSHLLRQCKPLRTLLDGTYHSEWGIHNVSPSLEATYHMKARKEIHTWLVCHPGIRLRCLIILDLLWAEASRLNDLPPQDIITAANAKVKTGTLNRKRIRNEILAQGGISAFPRAIKLSNFLKYSEWKKNSWSRGLNKKKMNKNYEEWTTIYLDS